VYPIFKNGTNSLKAKQLQEKWKIYVNGRLKKLNEIIVFWRPAFERYISGVNSFIQFQLRDNPDLDITTLKFLIKKFPFLDRHYCPQYFWLINLKKFSECKILIKPLSKINEIVDLDLKPGEAYPNGLERHQNHISTSLQTPVTDELIEEFNFMKNNDYLKIDDIIFEKYSEKSTELETLQQIWTALD
jgi:hypothetical protein